MFNNLMGLGYGVIGLALIIGVGTIVLEKFATVTACDSAGSFPTYNATDAFCYNSTGSHTAISSGATNTNYMNTQLGQSGLAGWTPAIIALSIGLLFLGAFMVGKGKQY